MKVRHGTERMRKACEALSGSRDNALAAWLWLPDQYWMW